jgi:chromosome partitioning protein
MNVITLVSAKGGAGKSTLSAALGVAAEAAGERVVLIDADIEQRSLSAWGEIRQAPTPRVECVQPNKLTATIDRLAKDGCTLVVIDTPGRDAPGVSAAMTAAQLALIPIRASMFDIRAAQLTISALARLGRPYAFILNSCPPGKSTRITDASRVLTMLGPTAPSIVQRADHVDAMALGLGPSEMGGKAAKAAAEITALWDWVKQRVKYEASVLEQLRSTTGDADDGRTKTGTGSSQARRTTTRISVPK